MPKPTPLPTTMLVGSEQTIEVPILRREWKLWDRPGLRPRKLNKDTPVIRPVIEHNGKPTFAEIRAAEELAEAGAVWWCWIDLFNRAYFQAIYDAGPPVTPPRDILEKLSRIWIENGGSLSGAWDAFGVLPDGRLCFREVKQRGKDALRDQQHQFADAARRAYPDVELAVVEWTPLH
jgi:hypothetical protein